MSKNKNDYTSKQQRNEFFRWVITNYGYDKASITDNPRVLSDKYFKERHLRIPKITIYRWLQRFERFISDEYQVEGLNYINSNTLNQI